MARCNPRSRRELPPSNGLFESGKRLQQRAPNGRSHVEHRSAEIHVWHHTSHVTGKQII